MRSSSLEVWLVLAGVAMAGCDDPPRSSAHPDASVVGGPTPPPREGCARAGSMEAIESDPSCAVRRVDEDAMHSAMKQLSITMSAEPPEVVPGAISVLTLTIRNTSSTEATIFFELKTRTAGPRTDWARVSGIPEARGSTGQEAPRLFFPMTTLDARDHDVDALPLIPNSGERGTPQASTAGVRLRAGGKLTHTMSWWAYRIPAPAPIVHLDGGHRYVPKTAATNLDLGEYTIAVDLPLYGLTKEERRVATHVRVVRSVSQDAGR